MKRLHLGLSCALALSLLCGCADSGEPFSRFFQDILSGLHLVAPSAGHHSKSSEFCILDPVAYAQQSADPIPATEKPPVAELPETTYDFGKISGQTEVVHQFSVRNTGKSVLNIKKVVPG